MTRLRRAVLEEQLAANRLGRSLAPPRIFSQLPALGRGEPMFQEGIEVSAFLVGFLELDLSFESGSVVSQILQPLHTLGHWGMGTEEVGQAACPQGIDNIHLCLGGIDLHWKPMIPILQLE